MIRADIFYNKKTDRMDFFFPEFEVMPCSDYNNVETVIINCDLVYPDETIRRRVKYLAHEVDSFSRARNGKLTWTTSSTNTLGRGGIVLKKTRILTETARKSDYNILYTKCTFKSTVSFLTGGSTYKRFNYFNDRETLPIGVKYSDYLKENKAVLNKFFSDDLLNITPFDADIDTSKYVKVGEILDYFNYVDTF